MRKNCAKLGLMCRFLRYFSIFFTENNLMEPLGSSHGASCGIPLRRILCRIVVHRGASLGTSGCILGNSWHILWFILGVAFTFPAAHSAVRMTHCFRHCFRGKVIYFPDNGKMPARQSLPPGGNHNTNPII